MSDGHIDADAFAVASRELENLLGLAKVLRDDVRRFRAGEDSAMRRAFVRAVFSCIEGTSFGFRYAALHLARTRGVTLSPGEIQMCKEVTYVLDERGQVEERQLISSSLANVRFALRIFSKSVGSPYEFPAGESGFEKLQVAQRIRNRLTHPRRLEELEVTSDEQDVVATAFDWIDEQQTRVVAAAAFRLFSGLQAFYDGVKALPKTSSGGYVTADVARIFSKEIGNSEPFSLQTAMNWCSLMLEAQRSRTQAAPTTAPLTAIEDKGSSSG
jgi:hypothetical protein